MHVRGSQTIGRYERVDVNAARFHADCGAYFNVADGPRRNPWQNVLDLVVGQRRKVRSAQNGDDVCGRSPTLLMPDEGEINRFDRSRTRGYTGN